MRVRHVRRALCVIHEAGNLDLEQRCHGFAAALAATGARTSVLDVNLQHTSAAEQRIAAALRGGRFDGLLTLGGAVIASPTLRRPTQRPSARPDHLRHVRHRPAGASTPSARARSRSPPTSSPILQGYLPIVLLTQYHLYGVLPDRGRLISTGPVFITRRQCRSRARA